MTSPVDPNVDPSAPPVASPAPGAAGMDEEIRQLARALNVQVPDALTARKAVIESVDLGDASTAPTVGVDLGGVSITGVRLAASYSPQVGDTVLLLKQGNQFFAAFKIADVGSRVSNSLAGGWTKATLASGVTHQGNNGGDVMYRRVNRDGSWAVEWQGCAALNGSQAQLLDASTGLLPTEYRPTLRRVVSVARNITNNGVPNCYLDMTTSAGNVSIVGGTWSLDLGDSGAAGGYTHSHGGATGVTDPTDGLANAHSHAIFDSSSSDHTHDLGTAGPNHPDWISFDGLFYYL